MDQTITLETPALVIMKAEKLVSTNKADHLLDGIDKVLDDYTFPVFCSFLNVYLRELEGSEVLRDEQRPLMQSYISGTFQSERESNEIMLRHYFNLILQDVCKWFRNEECMEHLVVKMTEDRVGYLMKHYAIQKVAREVAEYFEFDGSTPQLLEEAKQRKLPAIAKLLQTCLDAPYLFAQRVDTQSSNPLAGIEHG